MKPIYRDNTEWYCERISFQENPKEIHFTTEFPKSRKTDPTYYIESKEFYALKKWFIEKDKEVKKLTSAYNKHQKLLDSYYLDYKNQKKINSKKKKERSNRDKISRLMGYKNSEDLILNGQGEEIWNLLFSYQLHDSISGVIISSSLSTRRANELYQDAGRIYEKLRFIVDNDRLRVAAYRTKKTKKAKDASEQLIKYFDEYKWTEQENVNRKIILGILNKPKMKTTYKLVSKKNEVIYKNQFSDNNWEEKTNTRSITANYPAEYKNNAFANHMTCKFPTEIIFQSTSKHNGKSDKLKGKVKWFNARKGYGFIKKEDGTDIFCHISAVNVEGYKTLRDDQEVEFKIETNEKGERATNVTPHGKIEYSIHEDSINFLRKWFKRNKYTYLNDKQKFK